MNLIKSFNYKYLKENIKKSKGLIILLLIVVPLLTTLFTVLVVNGDKTVNLASEISINWVNMIGMYIVPIGISFALFGYIYKKSSVDLINSMPINKQTIFITNTIGGIILITLMQVITVALLFICGLACANLVIFTKMLIDIFIVMWVAYIFVFLATNLAMTVSGTFFTQLVLTVLILFLVPFITICINEDPNNTTYKIVYGSSEQDWKFAYESTYFTAPVHIPLAFLESRSLYSTVSLAKTIVLGIIYLILGVILFKRRKMEDTEESFRNEKIHLLVKALTVFPMIVFLNVLNLSKIITIFIIAIIAIYYFAYDFIVKRKVKLMVSIVALVLTLVLSYALAVGIEKLDESIGELSRKINANDIKEVAIKLDVGYLEEDSYFIDDEEILNLIINLRSNNTQYLLDNVDNNPPKEIVNVNFKTKTGKILKTNLDMYSDEFNTLIELLSKNEEYVNHVKSEYINDGRITINGYLVSQDVEEAINLNLKEKINNMTLLEVYENAVVNDSKYNCSLVKVYYDNHKYTNKIIDVDISNEISRMVIDYQNQLSSKYIKEISTQPTNSANFTIVGDLYCNEIIELEDYNSYYNITYLNNTKNDIIKFIKDNENVECDPSKDFYQISCYDYELNFTNIFYTNKIDEINEILKKEYDANNSAYYPEDIEIVY